MSPKSIKNEKGIFDRKTGLPGAPGVKGRLSVDPKDLDPLLQQLERETGEQLVLADKTEFNAAVTHALAKRKELEKGRKPSRTR